MATDLITYAVSSGEISPALYGRTDLEKYDLGLALARNFFVDYRGGASNRPGSRFGDIVQYPNTPTKFFRFVFSPEVANTYIILFGQNYIRFIQDGAYVLEDAVSITSFTLGPVSVVNKVAHGYSTGDLIKIVGGGDFSQRTFVVGGGTADAFVLVDTFGDNIDSTGYTTGAAVMHRVYTLESPYNTNDLERVQAHQNYDTLRFTHADYPIYDLTRASHTSWAMNPMSIGNGHTAPPGVTGAPSTSGSAGMAWAVTAISYTGEESRLSPVFVEQASVAYNTTAGFYLVSWTPVPNTRYYNVYRSLIFPQGSDVTTGAQLGYLGRTSSQSFQDNNIVPNFAITPPTANNPFANGAMRIVNVLTGGSGYSIGAGLTVTDPTGVGFQGYPVIANGEVVAVVVVTAGQDYTSPTFSVAGGSGATFAPVFGPSSGNNPACGTRFQQRSVFASSRNKPITVWGSRPGRYNNFDVSPVVVDSDSFEFDIDTEDLAPIRHMFSMRGGLLLMTQTGVYQLTGGNGVAVTPSNALSEPQSYTGVSTVPPLKVETDLLYIEGKGYTIRMLTYTEISKVYSGTDVSILSNHLFGKTKQVKNWAFAQDPFRLVWAVRSDGTMLSFTTVKEQNVFAWTQHTTQGYYRDVISVQENEVDVVYLTTQRYVNGKVVTMFEQIAERSFSHVEESFFVDCGLALTPTYPNATVYPTGITGTVGVISNVAIFTLADVGKVIRVAGGKGVVTAFVNSREITVRFNRPVSEFFPETDIPINAAPGTWTLDTPVSTIGGLWHLEGEAVSVLADGNVIKGKVVANGKITLETPATRVVVGLGYTSVLRTLPNTVSGAVIEGRRRRQVGLSIQQNETRGLKQGMRLDRLYELKERTNEIPGEPIEIQNGRKYTTVEASWDANGQVYLVQDNPLPATILGTVFSLEVGDDPE